MKKHQSLIIACLASATAGVVIGMLLAPDDKEKFKKDLKALAGTILGKLQGINGQYETTGDLPEDENPVPSPS